MIKQYCRKVKGKTLQIVGQFLQYSFFSNSFFYFFYSYTAGSQVISRGDQVQSIKKI